MAIGLLRKMQMLPRLKMHEVSSDEEQLAWYTGKFAAQLNRGLHRTQSYKV